MYSLSFNFHQRSWWIYVFIKKQFIAELLFAYMQARYVRAVSCA